MSRYWLFPLLLLTVLLLGTACNTVEQPTAVRTLASYPRPTEIRPTQPKPIPLPTIAPQRTSWHVTKMSNVRTTAYSHLENEPGAYKNQTAIGTVLKYGNVRSAAADWSRFPLGTQFRIEGEPYIYEVEDYGSALVGSDTIDLYKPTLKAMNDWGLRFVDIEIIKWGSYQRSAAILAGRTKYAQCKKMYDAIQPKLKSPSSNRL